MDQFFRFEEGEGKVFIDRIEHAVKDGDAIIVHAGAQHNFLNTSQNLELKLYNLFASGASGQGRAPHQSRGRSFTGRVRW